MASWYVALAFVGVLPLWLLITLLLMLPQLFVPMHVSSAVHNMTMSRRGSAPGSFLTNFSRINVRSS